MKIITKRNLKFSIIFACISIEESHYEPEVEKWQIKQSHDIWRTFLKKCSIWLFLSFDHTHVIYSQNQYYHRRLNPVIKDDCKMDKLLQWSLIVYFFPAAWSENSFNFRCLLLSWEINILYVLISLSISKGKKYCVISFLQ